MNNQTAIPESDALERMTVLYVEDDAGLREILAQAMEPYVARVLTASNGMEGLALFRGQEPDIVVTDVSMPGMDGLAMTRAIRNASPTTPIILATSLDDPRLLAQAIDSGVDCYVPKPIKIPLLLSALHKCAHLLEADTELKLAQTVFETCSDAIFVTDAQNHIITINPAFTEVTGYSREEVIGKSPKLLSSGRQSAEFYQELWQKLQNDGRWEGEIWNRRKNGEVYAERLAISVVRNRQGRITHYVAICSDISRRKEDEAQVALLAYYDALTGLPNRNLFFDRVNQALLLAKRNNGNTSLLFIDLDHFKPVNDKHGHLVGDSLLQQVAGRMRTCVRHVDTVARMGGDEFIVLLPEINHADDAKLVADKLLESIARPFRIDGQDIRISASIGIVIFPRDGITADQLLLHADQAMYKVKQTTRNNLHFFQPGDDL